MLSVSFRKNLAQFEINLSFNVKEYEYIIILGESGAGKSFTSKIIAGLELPDEGKIFLKEQDITFFPPEKRKISYLPQGNLLFPHMTVFENLFFPFKIRNIKMQIAKEKIYKIASAFKIDKVLDKFSSSISGGEAQRVALARAILSDPEIIILDEPLNSLDFFNKFELINFIKKTIKRKKTVIHITHDPIEAKELADRVFYMDNGRLKFADTWKNFIEKAEGKLPSKIRKLLSSFTI